jgi:AcrR family transcriptional regulator
MCMEIDRKTRADWTDAGLRALESEGHGALKAKPLAEALSVTRGSFYWHFKSLGDFHSAVLLRWRERKYEEIVADVSRQGGQRLHTLLNRALSEPSRLEVAVRSWALVYAEAARVVDEVDLQRTEFIAATLAEIGCPVALQPSRAKLLNWAYLGFALNDRPIDRAERKRMAEDVLAFAASPGSTSGFGIKQIVS